MLISGIMESALSSRWLPVMDGETLIPEKIMLLMTGISFTNLILARAMSTVTVSAFTTWYATASELSS